MVMQKLLPYFMAKAAEAKNFHACAIWMRLGNRIQFHRHCREGGNPVGSG